MRGSAQEIVEKVAVEWGCAVLRVRSHEGVAGLVCGGEGEAPRARGVDVGKLGVETVQELGRFGDGWAGSRRG